MRRIAMVVSTVGYQWEEVIRPYFEFLRAGYEVEVYTVDGAQPKADPRSLTPMLVGAAVGLGLPDDIAPETHRGQKMIAALAAARPLSVSDAEALDALYLPGGHGCLADVNVDPRVHALVARLYDRGCILSAVCHATSTFALTRSHGRPIAAGCSLTGFPAALDAVLIRLGLVDERFLPLPFSNEAALEQNWVPLTALDKLEALVNPRLVRVSTPFITGVGPKAAQPVARAVVAALSARVGLWKPPFEDDPPFDSALAGVTRSHAA